ncbi:MAG: hypothetical protein EAX96_16505 [Candidatus Lokiarchaeota archaeon]|nr:hypothetical protein [Candidatus Lokiarchaeota archaeon]
MSAMSNDAVFQKWLDSAQDKKLKKYFGNDFDRNSIIKENYVKNSILSVAFFFKAKIDIAPPTSSGKKNRIEVGEKKFLKTKFYKFTHPGIDPAFWKGPNEVPSYDSIKTVACEKCISGAIKCKNCGGTGHQECQKCKGTGKLKCKRCGGEGKIENKLQVIERGATSEEKKKLKYDLICPLCHGLGASTCPSCNGFGKNTCKNCKGLGSASCKNCGGTGAFYQYEMIPVPFGRSSVKPAYEYYFIYNPDVEKKIQNDLEEMIELMDGIRINDHTELNENLIQQAIGTFSSDIERRIKKCKQLFEKLEKKDPTQSPLYPILIIPIIQLDLETPTNKKFSIFGMGTSNNFTVLTTNF